MPSQFNPANQILNVLVPVLLSCFCVVLTALFSDTGNSLFNDCLAAVHRPACMQNYLQLYWALSMLLWGAILILSSAVPAWVNPHMPLLLCWTVWISLRSDFQLGRLADVGTAATAHPVPWFWSPMLLLLFAVAALLVRQRVAILLLCVLELSFLSAMPKAHEIQISMMIVQALYFCGLYFLSLLLVPSQRDSVYILNIVMSSFWALWINDMLHLTILVLAYVGLSLLAFAMRYESTQLWVNFNRMSTGSAVLGGGAGVGPTTEETPADKRE